MIFAERNFSSPQEILKVVFSWENHPKQNVIKDSDAQETQ
jgi:hypothetical protein